MHLTHIAPLFGLASAQLVNQATGSQQFVIDSVSDLTDAAANYKNCQ